MSTLANIADFGMTIAEEIELDAILAKARAQARPSMEFAADRDEDGASLPWMDDVELEVVATPTFERGVWFGLPVATSTQA